MVSLWTEAQSSFMKMNNDNSVFLIEDITRKSFADIAHISANQIHVFSKHYNLLCRLNIAAHQRSGVHG